METCIVVPTFESVDEIQWYGHSNETSLAVLLHGTICFFNILQNKIWDFLILAFGTLGSEGLNKGIRSFVHHKCTSAFTSSNLREDFVQMSGASTWWNSRALSSWKLLLKWQKLASLKVLEIVDPRLGGDSLDLLFEPAIFFTKEVVLS